VYLLIVQTDSFWNSVKLLVVLPIIDNFNPAANERRTYRNSVTFMNEHVRLKLVGVGKSAWANFTLKTIQKMF